MSLLYIGQQLYIYFGLSLFIIGLIGNAINIFIFTYERTYRAIPSIFYFLIGSISNILFVALGLANRIQLASYGRDFSDVSIIWCKMRFFLTTVFMLLSLTCLCLSAIDQVLVTSRNPSVRRHSQIKWAHRIVFIVIIFWLLYGIPTILYYNISPVRNICTIINIGFSIFIPISVLVILCIIPILIIIPCGWLTYRNIRRTIALADQNADRQLIKMTFFQVILVIAGYCPYAITYIYLLITANVTKDNQQKIIDSFMATLVNMTNNVFNCVCTLISFSFYLKNKSYIYIYLGKLLYIFIIIASFSSNGEMSIILSSTR